MQELYKHLKKYKNAYYLFYDIAMLCLAIFGNMYLLVGLIYFIELTQNSRR